MEINKADKNKLSLVKPLFLSYNKRAAAYGGLFV
jgi:hypothetical protein